MNHDLGLVEPSFEPRFIGPITYLVSKNEIGYKLSLEEGSNTWLVWEMRYSYNYRKHSSKEGESGTVVPIIRK